MMEVGGKKRELQKEEESRSHPRDDEASSSGSMLTIGATMTVSSDPEYSGSEEHTDEEFTPFSWPPQFLLGLHENLKHTLLGDEFRPVYQRDSTDGSDSDDSEESNEKHDSSSDPSDNHNHDAHADDVYSSDPSDNHNHDAHADDVYSSDPSDNHNHDVHANDVYGSDHVKVQEQGMPPGVFHLHNMQAELADMYTNAIERSGKGVEVKEEEEEEHEESGARSQWKDQKAPLPGSPSEDDDTMPTSIDTESNEREGSFQEEFSVAPLSPSFVPGQVDDSEDDLTPPSHPPGYQESLFGCMRPGRCPSCFWPYKLSLCRLS